MPLTLRIDNRTDLPAAAREHTFAACGGTVGRAPDNDWVLPDERRYVSSRHAVIDFQAGAYYLVDTSRNGVFVNGADTPVGRGHPQRLFDGDRLRIGDLQIAIEISGDETNIPDDGMRDSIVRAQLVAEEPSVELLLVSEDQLISDGALQRHLAPGTDLVRQATPLTTPKPAAARPATEATGRSPRPDSAGDADLQRAVTLLLDAAGVTPASLAGTTPAEVLAVAGRVLRLAVGGLMELLEEGKAFRSALGITARPDAAARRNPLRLSPDVAAALRQLLADRDEGSYLNAGDAIAEACRDLRQHAQASLRALVEAGVDYSEQFDPDELRRNFDKGLKRGGLLGQANKLRYWDLYAETYPDIAQRDDGAPPKRFTAAFARAYTDELESLRARKR
ncbi:MAG: type VI secretion system-associated FHA domain protein TagH [Chromatiales bacterium]|jgi:type VI secretion system protein ImpI|nr:type VI secretion system-associated FHA domain protein TagH [Chromatiales bacterium]